ncbi:hypothetical protein [Larkinella rosea]|uniref:Uncharacterized protein n=1 Tax=Larkinella rosea TaxID=2025312 RepID=A0A3P1C2C8_9BACT|nr:hypothetical protein [Larkinella rosea]RRB07256.1 hypothetical protein EHT25_05625 [Larkinella rosea]
MEKDLLYKGFFFGGVYGLAFFLIYRFGRKTAPVRAVWLSVGSWCGLMVIMLTVNGASSALLFFPAFFAALFVVRRNAENREIRTLQAFFTENRLYKAEAIPEQVSRLLGSSYYSCAVGTLTGWGGEEITYHWWQGMTSSLVSTGKSTITTFSYYLAVSFASSVINDAFKNAVRAKADTSTLSIKQKFKRFFVLDTETPVRIAETADGSFVVIWQTCHDVPHFAYYVSWLTATLSASKSETNKRSATENKRVSPGLSTRELHESTLGQAPKSISSIRSSIPRS